jgi:hypothetical protein
MGSMRKTVFVFFALLILLTACQAQQTPLPVVDSTPTNQPTETLLPVPSDTPAPTLTPTPGFAAPPPGLTHYEVQAEWAYNAHTLQVRERVSYINRIPDPRTELVFLVHAARFPFVFELQAIEAADGARLNSYTLQDGVLTVSLPQALPPGETIRLQIVFALYLPQREGTLGYTARQSNLANWFPMLAPYVDGQGWIVHQPAGFGEYMSFEAADFDVRLKLDRADVIVAASAPAVLDGEWMHYNLPAARGFTLSASPFYQVAERSVGSASIRSYWFSETNGAGNAVLDVVERALLVYGEKFGPYPRSLLSVVEADFLHGMEYDGLFFLSRGFYENYTGTPQSNLTIIAAHETSHQWWYSLVGNDPAQEPWLDEAMATYCELIYYERYQPELVNWWWDNRIRFFDPQGWVDSTIYQPQTYEAYRDAVYLRGAMMLDSLRKQVGEAAFEAALRDYAVSAAYGLASRADFWAAFERHSDVDLSTFKSQFFQYP